MERALAEAMGLPVVGLWLPLIIVGLFLLYLGWRGSLTRGRLPLPGLHPFFDIAKVVDKSVVQLEPGRVEFNPPADMKVGESERIEVRIARTLAIDLSKDLRGRGTPTTENLRVSPLMKVVLFGDGFRIKAFGEPEQVVSVDDFTQWEWDVTPRHPGVHKLTLRATARLEIPGLEEQRKDVLVLDKDIKVEVNAGYQLNQFWGKTGLRY